MRRAPEVPADVATQVARLFYDRQLSKVEIGGRLGMSRFRVARLLDHALANDLVRIEFRDTPAGDRGLARALEERFGLDLCIVAADGPSDARDRVARLAGSFVGDLVGHGDVVGIAWGSTLAAFVREVPTRQDDSIEVVQLAGSSVRLGRERDPGELARVLADRLGAAHRPLHAPVFVDDPAGRRALLAEPDLAATLAAFDRLTMAVVGIGAFGGGRTRGGSGAFGPDGEDGAARAESSLVRSGVLDAATVKRLRERGAVGDLVVHAFDAAGRFVAPDLAERSIAIGVDQLRRVPRVVAIAAGAAKAEAIRGALATGSVRVLATDAAAAAAILALENGR
ncbi:MAG TPA: sugar-binding domain-containing protein [Candidatus Limnocylindrales bacterium]|nr:sugar-binding domain-containing protein [Candidatus Limnocylindrales bacterium]